MGTEQGKEVNCGQKEQHIESIAVENTGLLKAWQLVWLEGDG